MQLKVRIHGLAELEGEEEEETAAAEDDEEVEYGHEQQQFESPLNSVEFESEDPKRGEEEIQEEGNVEEEEEAVADLAID